MVVNIKCIIINSGLIIYRSIQLKKTVFKIELNVSLLTWQRTKKKNDS